ncbi:hypothetical protein E2C01_062314 [Portunus trituberculatus]|uniref:Uncharacterized protein n=1 Tax=Portunus trituberculatus TaxID=210409 RepID=A0A5B7HE92_PORTR|nr:hypothetical protein [Portunus trituberculatus]
MQSAVNTPKFGVNFNSCFDGNCRQGDITRTLEGVPPSLLRPRVQGRLCLSWPGRPAATKAARNAIDHM